ncbi:hypothetical protein GTZ99_12510 [Novosphingobium sp. FSY-8]|uniref:SGNH hydrolase-type esterase domain-containing protein n=1 Tax=Novosphingobium ovatum TaxID=1908523 RepID=A0ABW9XFW7_9SPHN|nr:SGNH/GDSL hydrolase family protein [Novosphingobium ovatum]NBC37373.1 hypothetical protein [Novosphingobium ovatum]
MADVTITVSDGAAIVQPFGADALTPFLTAASGLATAAQGSANDAQTSAALASGAANYRATFAAALADFAVGEGFTTDALGRMAAYRRISAAPGYEFVAVSIATDVPVSAEAYETAPVSSLTAVTGTLAGTVHVQASTDGAPVPAADGVLFDSAGGDLMTALSYPADAALTVASGSIAFANASTDKALDCMIKGPDGNLLQWCGDAVTVDATFTLTSFPAADRTGALVGAVNNTLGLYAAELKAHPSAATRAFARLWNAGAIRASDSSYYAFSAGASIRVRYAYVGNQVTATWTYPATADHVLTETQVFAHTSDEMPRMFSTLGVRFVSGAMSLTALKVSAPYAGATFACLGNSLTQGREAASYANGWASLLRADYPGDVLIFGAPSSKTSDWISNHAVTSVVAMAPKYAFVELGTNDFIAGRTLSAIEADYTTLIGQLIAGGITPICLTAPPIGNANVPTFNAWLKAQAWPVIDIYAVLVGTGTALNATYDSGDHTHWNDAGHAAVRAAVRAYIDAQGLIAQAQEPYLISNTLTDNARRVPTSHAVYAALEAFDGQFAETADLAALDATVDGLSTTVAGHTTSIAALNGYHADETTVGEEIRTAADAAAGRSALGLGTASTRDTGYFVAASAITSGSGTSSRWHKFPDGSGGYFLEQWGYVPGGSEGPFTVSFPVEYSHVPSIGDIQLTGVIPSNGDYDTWPQLIDGTITAAGFQVRVQWSGGTAGSTLHKITWRVKAPA